MCFNLKSNQKKSVYMKSVFLCVFLFLFSSCRSTLLPEAAPESLGVSSDALISLVDKLDKEVDGMHGIVILRHGKVISKGWWAPYREENTHILYSLSKSFCSTAIGMAVDEGLLSLDDKVVKFFPDELPQNPSENLKAMTIKDLLIMGTGNHNDTLGAIKESEDKNWPKIFLAQPVEHKPGSFFKYNTGATYMLSAILQKVTGQKLVDFLKPRLFDPLGIKEYSWEEDPMGVNTGGYGLKVRTEAIAKFGQLYLQKGMWEGKRLLSEEWINMATSKQINNGSNPKSDWNQGYGFQFWMCRHNAYRGDGAFGQYCIVMPEQDAVIAIHSGVKNMQQVLNIIWDNFLPAVQKEPLPENPASFAKLQEKMSSLNLPKVKKLSVPSAGIVGQTYHFEENEKGFKSISVQDRDEHTYLKLENAHGTQYIYFTRHLWVEDEIILEKNLKQAVGASNGVQKIACNGAWQSPNHLRVVMYMIEAPFKLTFDLKFNGGKLTMDLNYNIIHGPKDYKFKASK